jgi:hypothetical protein
MLKDALLNLMKNNDGDKCKLGKLIGELDKETAEMLSNALRSNVATTVLCRTLNNEGIKISREFLGTQRKQCFLSPGSSPKCCLNKTDANQENNNE